MKWWGGLKTQRETRQFSQAALTVCEAAACVRQTGGDGCSVPEQGALFLCGCAGGSPAASMMGKIIVTKNDKNDK